VLSKMQAIKLQRKYPEVSQEEMFDLINRFKCVFISCYLGDILQRRLQRTRYNNTGPR
jgi:hypothetical protein